MSQTLNNEVEQSNEPQQGDNGMLCCPDEFPPFKARFPWWGGFLQTARTRLGAVSEKQVEKFRKRQLKLPTTDDSGDILTADLLSPAKEDATIKWPLIVLLHGLGGTSQSVYIRSCAHALVSAGHRVVRLNFRGAGDSAPRCDFIHHPGRTEDVAALFEAVQADAEYKHELEKGVFLVGFSLGGSVLLQFLAEASDDLPIVGAVTISAPLDLTATSKCLARWSRFPFQRYLLGKMKSEVLRDNVTMTDTERKAVTSARSVWDFDEQFVSPRCGYHSVEEYYRENSAINVLGDVKVETYLLYATDDPVVPSDSYENFDWASHPNLTPVITDSGGHVGFHAVGKQGRWHEQCIQMLARQCDRSDFRNKNLDR